MGISNLLVWFPVIWNDRNWDHHYFFLMLRFKLSRMEKYFRKHGISARATQDSDQISTCIKLLDRLIGGDYNKLAYEQHDKKWGTSEFKFTELKDQLGYKMDIERPNVVTEKDKEKQRTEIINLAKHEEYLENQDVQLLFKIIGKHVQTWWD